MGKNASNIGVRSELGRLPLIYNIISTICKYRMQLEYHTDGDLLFHAFKSQLRLNSNSYNTLTYSKFTKEVFQELGFPTIPMIKSNTIKRTLNSLVKPVMDNCRKYYINWFKDKLASLKNSEESKLQIFTLLKGQYQYECFLDHTPFGKYIARFKLSAHNLPIERGRYTKPKTPRNLRMCTLCSSEVGNEIHAMFKYQNDDITGFCKKYMGRILKISPQINSLSDADKLLYLLKGVDTEIINITGEWLYNIDQAYKKRIV